MALRRSRLAALTILPLLAGLPALAFAHTEEGVVGGFISGFLHPVYGPDHVVAMVAVGMWGAFLRNPAIWVLPVVFPLVMAFGGALGVIGMPLPLVEVGIASSAIVLGLMVLLAVRPPLWIAAGLVGAFGSRDRSLLVAQPVGHRAPSARARRLSPRAALAAGPEPGGLRPRRPRPAGGLPAAAPGARRPPAAARRRPAAGPRRPPGAAASPSGLGFPWSSSSGPSSGGSCRPR